MPNPSRTVLSPEGRLSFCHMISPKEFKEKGKGTGKFSYITDLIFKPDDLKKFRMPDPANPSNLIDVDLPVLLAGLAKEAWGAQINPETNQPWTVKEMFAGVAVKGWPIKNGDQIADRAKAANPPKDYEQYRGMKSIAIKSNVSEKTQPPVLSQATPKGKRVFNRTLEADMQVANMLFQGGNYAVAEINFVANEVGGMKYLTPYVNSIRFTREGAKLGRSGGDLMDKFGGVGGGAAAHDPTEGMDDEIPF